MGHTEDLHLAFEYVALHLLPVKLQIKCHWLPSGMSAVIRTSSNEEDLRLIGLFTSLPRKTLSSLPPVLAGQEITLLNAYKGRWKEWYVFVPWGVGEAVASKEALPGHS